MKAAGSQKKPHSVIPNVNITKLLVMETEFISPSQKLRIFSEKKIKFTEAIVKKLAQRIVELINTL